VRDNPMVQEVYLGSGAIFSRETARS
jgi:hypothetical protein